MGSDAIVGKGCLFKRGDGASNEAFSTVSEVNSIGLPKESRPMIDVTDLTSVIRVFRKGLKDGGQVALSMNFTRDTYIAMRADLDNDDSVNYQIVLSDTGATTIEFAGLCQDLGGDIPDPDQKVSVNVTFKVSGLPTISS